MANDYFDSVPVAIAAGTRARAAQVNAVSAATEAAFDLLPTETELKLGLTRYAVDTGFADAYVIDLPYTPTLLDGFQFSLKTVNENTGACTLNANGTGIKSITNSDGSPLVAGTLRANGIALLAYEAIADAYILISQNPEQAALAAVSAAAADASATAAAISEGNAASSETQAGLSETAAAASESAALASENAAALSEAAAEAAYDSFDDRYLGSKASDPTLDNDGDPLLEGALYWKNTAVKEMRVYNGVAWQGFTTDALTLGGFTASQYLRSDVSDTFTGTLNVVGDITISGTVDGIDIATDVAANTAKVTNATHTGQVTGAGALALDVTAVTAQPASGVVVGTDTMIINDGGVLSEVTIDQLDTFFTGGALSIGGSDTQLQYNNGGALGGIPDWAWDDGLDTMTITSTNSGGLSSTPIAIVADNLTAAHAMTFDVGNTGNLSVGGAISVIGQAGGGSSLTGIVQSQTRNATAAIKAEAATSVSNIALWAYTNTALRTGPLVLFEVDNSSSGVALELQQDGDAPHIELSGTQGTGIKFPASAQPSTDANVLDDYQEGTWTPTFQDASLSDGESQTYITQEGTYVKIGKLVMIAGRLQIDSLGTLSGAVNIGGLPFAVASAGIQDFAILCDDVSGFTGSMPDNSPVILRAMNGLSYCSLRYSGTDSNISPVLWTFITTGSGRINFSGTYIADE